MKSLGDILRNKGHPNVNLKLKSQTISKLKKDVWGREYALT